MESWIVGGKISTGEAFNQNSTNYFRFGSSIESSSATSRLRTRVPEAGTLRRLAVRCGTNTLTGNCTVTLRKNDTTDTALAVTFANTDSEVEKRDISDSVAMAVNDDFIGKVACAAGGTSILLRSHSVAFAPTNEGNTLSHLSVQSQGSSAFTTPGSSYVAPFGWRTPTTTESDARWTNVEPFTAVYFSAASGTTSYNQPVTIRTRKNGAAGGQSVTFTDTDDQVTKYDTSGSDTLADGDTFNYEVERGAGGSGTFNLENINIWFRNTASRFVIGAADLVSGNSYLASQTRYSGLGAELEKNATEAIGQLTAPFDMRLKLLQVLSRTETMTGTTVFTARVSGVASALTLTYGGTETGIKEAAGDVLLTGDTDALSTESVTGAGTARDINYIVYLIETPELVTDRDIQVPGGGATTDTGAGDLHIPGGGVVLPQSPVEITILEAEPTAEAITVVDSTTATYPATLAKDLSETVTAVDFQKVTLTPHEVFEVDELVVEDFLRAGLSPDVNKSEAVAVADALSIQFFAGVDLAETITTTDAATLAVTPVSMTFVETVAVEEHEVLDQGVALLAENIQVLDNSNLRVTPATLSRSETITVQDFVQFNSIFFQGVEPVQVTDAVSMSLGRKFVPPWLFWW